MTVIKNKSISKLIIGTLAFMVFSLFNFSYLLQNGSGSGYLEGGGDGSTLGKSVGGIETLVIRGAGYYLSGTTCIQSFLNQVEMQELTGEEPQAFEKSVSCALSNINQAVETYYQLIKMAEATPYNPVVIEQLKSFGYDTYMKENGYNAIIFNRVRGYLEKGEITGSLKNTYSGMIAIRQLLETINQEVTAGWKPDLSMIRKLNEKCAEITLFGSYAAGVFEAINQGCQ